jgi:hypothetical protein
MPLKHRDMTHCTSMHFQYDVGAQRGRHLRQLLLLVHKWALAVTIFEEVVDPM